MPNLRGKTWTPETPALTSDANFWEDHLMSDEDAEFIDELRRGGGLELNLLWTNPNPTEPFSARTIQLDLTAYKMVGIVFTVEAGNPARISNLFFLIKGITYGGGCCVGGVSQYLKSRSISSVTDSGITFGGGYNATNASGATNNSAMIPLYIYGI